MFKFATLLVLDSQEENAVKAFRVIPSARIIPDKHYATRAIYKEQDYHEVLKTVDCFDYVALDNPAEALRELIDNLQDEDDIEYGLVSIDFWAIRRRLEEYIEDVDLEPLVQRMYDSHDIYGVLKSIAADILRQDMEEAIRIMLGR